MRSAQRGDDAHRVRSPSRFVPTASERYAFTYGITDEKSATSSWSSALSSPAIGGTISTSDGS